MRLIVCGFMIIAGLALLAAAVFLTMGHNASSQGLLCAFVGTASMLVGTTAGRFIVRQQA